MQLTLAAGQAIAVWPPDGRGGRSWPIASIDAPGTGFSRIMGKDKEKAFWGVDQDAHAFERFIRKFLTKFDRWNSPKYLFGESYGTPRSAVLSAVLQNVDLNGIVLLSQILSFDNSIDGPKWNPGIDQAYALALPTFAATAFYHHKLPAQPAALRRWGPAGPRGARPAARGTA